jgi:phytanoyl-CoA hydroxylase
MDIVARIDPATKKGVILCKVRLLAQGSHHRQGESYDGNDGHRVRPAAVRETYQRDGYVLVKGLIKPGEARYMRQELHDLLSRASGARNGAWKSASSVAGAEGKQQLQGMHDLQFYCSVFSRMIVDPRFTGVAAAVLDAENVQLHHTKAFIKPPEKGAPFPLHQDHPFFPHTRHRVAAAIFHLDNAPAEKGCVAAVKGSHHLGPLEHIEEGSWHLPPDEWPVTRAEPVEAEAGDVLLFSYLTIHGSGVNTSNEARTTWLVQFRDPADLPIGDKHTFSRGQGMMLRGRNPDSSYGGP